MAFNVRMFGYKGIKQIEKIMEKQFNADSVFLLDEPYEWAVLVSVSAAAISTPTQSPDRATIVRIEVPDGQQIRYEFNPNGPLAVNARVANVNSPRLSGFDQFPWNAGASFSFIDAAGLP